MSHPYVVAVRTGKRNLLTTHVDDFQPDDVPDRNGFPMDRITNPSLSFR